MSVTLDTLINHRRAVRSYTKKKPLLADIKAMVACAQKAPSSCNLQLWEFVYVADTKILKQLQKIATPKIAWAPACFVVAYNPNLTFERQAHVVSVGIALENLMLKAVELGLATCPLAGFSGDDKIKTLLNIPINYQISNIVLVGYARNVPPKTYRSPPHSALHINSFRQIRPQLPISIHLKDWRKEQILEYRRRIFSTYLWRFHIHFFDLENVNHLWQGIKKYAKTEKAAYVFPWDHDFIPLLKKQVQNLFLADYNLEVLEHFSKTYNTLVLDINKPVAEKYLDAVFVLNKLEFETKPQQLLSSIHTGLKSEGKLILSVFNYTSLYIIVVRLAMKLSYFDHVYHKSPFYKWGPISFISKNSLKKMLTKSGFVIENQLPVSLNLTNALFNKYDHPMLRNLIAKLITFLGKTWLGAEVIVISARKKLDE